MKLTAPSLPFDAAVVRMEHAADKAERVEPGWKAEALNALRQHALTHETFLAQEVPMSIPADADPRAAGAILQAARREGWIKREGFGMDRWGSHKSLWRSLIVRGAA